jgi:hypothetical protein
VRGAWVLPPDGLCACMQAPTHSSWLPMPPAAAPWTSDGASAASSGFISSGAFGSSGQAPQAASVAAAQMIAARLAAQGQTGGNQESSVATAEAFAARLAAKDGQNPHSSQRESLPTGSGRFAPPSSLYSNQVEDSYAASRNQGNQGGRPDGGPRGALSPSSFGCIVCGLLLDKHLPFVCLRNLPLQPLYSTFSDKFHREQAYC